jgi:hypothetical protein
VVAATATQALHQNVQEQLAKLHAVIE